MNLQENSTNIDQKTKNPPWVDGRGISEYKFCCYFLEKHPMMSSNGTFFTVDGRIDDEEALRQMIYDEIKPYVDTGLSKKVNGLLEVLRMQSHSDEIITKHDRIHTANGTLIIENAASECSEPTVRFDAEKEFCRNRLPVKYNPSAPQPEKWLKFLSELLDESDIITLQEYIGYCLLPTTKAQRMLMLIGRGGEGKSRLGPVLRSIFGTNMSISSIAKVETNRFARADLEHQLLMLDDDMQLEALPQTNYIKTIITSELPMDLEKKGRQSYQGEMYVRFIGLGNGALQALYDKSDGFFRRQIILTTKERERGRIDDPYIAEKMCTEREGIFLWSLVGLMRLIGNGYRFTLSKQANANLRSAINDGCNVSEFMQSEDYFRRIPDGSISSKELYDIYKTWCEDNAYNAMSVRSFGNYISMHIDELGIKASNNIYLKSGRRVRGYIGISPPHIAFTNHFPPYAIHKTE